MKNIFLLPTNKKPNKGDLLLRHIWKGTPNECISWWRYNDTIIIDGVKQYTTLNGSFRDITSSFKVINIYITCDEDIKENDAYITKHGEICKSHNGSKILVFKTDKKIILTTDQDLIKGGVQKIDDIFIDWFINNPSCEFIEYNSNYNRVNGKYYYKTIIPKPETNESIDKEIDEMSQDFETLHLNMKITEKSKCTCERPDDNVCDYCDSQESKRILLEAKNRAKQQKILEEASMNYLSNIIDGKRTTGYADEDFREGYKFREQQEIDLAQGYLNANLENIEKMKTMFTLNDVERIAEHFYYKGISKAKNPQVKFNFNEFIKTFKKQ